VPLGKVKKSETNKFIKEEKSNKTPSPESTFDEFCIGL